MAINAITMYRIGRKCKDVHLPIVPRIIEGLIFLIFNSSISLDCDIDDGTICGHRGIAVVINKNAKIGKNCLIRPHVVIGGGGTKPGAPFIEDNVSIGVGAKLIGGIRIGEGANIGANAVVIEDVPPNSTAVGVPARILFSKKAFDE
jgi:serine O-acetyltransferase